MEFMFELNNRTDQKKTINSKLEKVGEVAVHEEQSSLPSILDHLSKEDAERLQKAIGRWENEGGHVDGQKSQ